MPENRNLSSRGLSPEKIDRRPKLRTQESHLFSVKEGAGTATGVIPLVVVQNFPNRFAKDPINLDSNSSRLFNHPGVTILEE
jgi:hypothetical protein